MLILPLPKQYLLFLASDEKCIKFTQIKKDKETVSTLRFFQEPIFGVYLKSDVFYHAFLCNNYKSVKLI